MTAAGTRAGTPAPGSPASSTSCIRCTATTSRSWRSRRCATDWIRRSVAPRPTASSLRERPARGCRPNETAVFRDLPDGPLSRGQPRDSGPSGRSRKTAVSFGRHPLAGLSRKLEAVGRGATLLRIQSVAHRLERHEREVVAVHRIHEVEDAGEPGAGVLALVPAAVIALGPEEALDALAENRIDERRAGGDQSEDRPRGLGRRARALALQHGVGVGLARLAPAAVGVLDRAEPGGGALDPAFAHVDP